MYATQNMYLRFDAFKSATEREKKLFWSYICGLRSAHDTISLLRNVTSSHPSPKAVRKYFGWSEPSLSEKLVNGVLFLNSYRLLRLKTTSKKYNNFKENDNLKNKDRYQLFCLAKYTPRNHMPVLPISMNLHKPLRKGLPPKLSGFLLLQDWQSGEDLFIQHLQANYARVSVHVFYCLQKYLKSWALSHPRSNYFCTDICTDKSSRKRFDAGIGRDNIFFLFKALKKMKKEIFVCEQENEDSVVAALKISPFPAFFWNCDQFYPLVFDFKLVKKQMPHYIGFAPPEPENKDDALDFYLGMDFYEAKINEYNKFHNMG